MSWIRNNLFPILTLFGIIVATIGAIIALPNTLKLVLGPTMPAYIYDTCRYETESASKRTQAIDYEKCLQEAEERERTQQQTRRVESLIDGFSTLLIGLAITAWSRRRDKKS